MSPEPGQSSDPLLVQAIKHLAEQVAQQRKEQQTHISSLNSRLDRLVTTETFSREQARVDDKIRDVATDVAESERRVTEKIAEERAAREKAIAAETAERKAGDSAQQTLLDKLGGNLKWVSVSLLLPIALFLANFFSNRGGA